MADYLAGWLLAATLGIPLAFAADRMARRAGAGPGRRAVVVALTVLAMPLGIGVWLGLLHRTRRHTTARP
ncbi:MAG: hypothetical protein QOE45_3404 [Frankiaceae bacterium]|nr:hypothetical protein [Frankiaceae bacterium]